MSGAEGTSKKMERDARPGEGRGRTGVALQTVVIAGQHRETVRVSVQPIP
jgi:hypothetical protein